MSRHFPEERIGNANKHIEIKRILISLDPTPGTKNKIKRIITDHRNANKDHTKVLPDII